MTPSPLGVSVFEGSHRPFPWGVQGYFGSAPDEVALALLAAAFGSSAFAVARLAQADWVAKAHQTLAPIVVGALFIHGRHDRHRVPAGAKALQIEAAQAFGSGHHSTTLGCLQALDALAGAGVPVQRAADIGCGTAILAMAVARLWPQAGQMHPIVASDSDSTAIEVAQANALVNGLGGRLRCVQATGLAHPHLQRCQPFDLLLANILANPLRAMAPAMGRAAAPGGHAILSGILPRQAAGVLKAYARAGFQLRQRQQLEEWITLLMQREGC